ncbi:hypothetical protein DL98DRAFT_519331 [Cadophora sp. DSE1049]|nr:hypothetical protein DL98DRAFT_519331 [Cadophora sp. DSE1049]
MAFLFRSALCFILLCIVAVEWRVVFACVRACVRDTDGGWEEVDVLGGGVVGGGASGGRG